MSRVVHFEIPADNPERAVGFYKKVFGWTFNKWDGPMDYWLIETGDENTPGINGGLLKREHPGQGLSNVVDVSSVDAFTQKVIEAGGTIVVPKMALPGIGYVVYYQDPEGNVLGMMEHDESAAAQ